LFAIGVVSIFAALHNKLVRTGLIWIIIPLLPVLNTLSFKPEDLVHDRYLYLSLFGFGLLFAAAVKLLNEKIQALEGARKEVLQSNEPKVLRPSVTVVVLAIMILMGLVTIKQNPVWTDEWSLWNAAAQNVPDSCVVNLELGRLSEEGEKVSDAEFYY